MANVVFCQRVVYSYFGVMTMSAVLKSHGHKTELVMQSDPSLVVSEILSINPDMVMFSTVTATGDFEWALSIAQNLKQHKPSMLMVFGSTHPTLFPEETMSHWQVDIACRGEGEMAVLELCNRYQAQEDYSRIPGLWVRTPNGVVSNAHGHLVEDLDQFPFPDRSLYDKYGYFDRLDSIDVIAGRGCIFDCSYCMNTTSKEMMRGSGKFVRKHSVDYMMRQLKEIKARYNPKSITFVDELFTTNKRWVKEFCDKYPKEIALPFICSVTADTIDEDIAKWLSDAGVFRVCFGLESGNEQIRNNLLNKRFSNAQFIESAERLHRNKIKFLTTNMIGLPGETIEHAFETIELNQKVKTDFLYFSVFQPYPQLPITKQLQKEGKLADLKPADYHTTFFQGSLVKQDNIQQLVNLHKFFFVAVKFPWAKPLIRKLIDLPSNWLFEQVFIISYGWMQLVCFRRNPWQLLAMGLGNLKVFYGKK
jgi:anaerobic magnesium-protoporphyrin IX monomethyl ester cyclase